METKQKTSKIQNFLNYNLKDEDVFIVLLSVIIGMVLRIIYHTTI